VSVSGYSGAGFFGVVTTMKQVVVLEFSIAVGYFVALELGQLGTGEVSAFVGIYYRRERDTYVLEGFLIIKGHVSFFSLVDVSISLSLHLRYVSQTNSLVGEAILRLSVDVLFFHASREYRVKREYAGSSRGFLESGREQMSFTRRVSREHWNQYVSAFA